MSDDASLAQTPTLGILSAEIVTEAHFPLMRNKVATLNYNRSVVGVICGAALGID
jgi:hypothetical protein